MEMSVFAERNAIGFSSIIVTISLTIAIDGSQCHHRHRYLNWCASLASRVLPLLLFLWQHDCFFGYMAASLATWRSKDATSLSYTTSADAEPMWWRAMVLKGYSEVLKGYSEGLRVYSEGARLVLKG